MSDSTVIPPWAVPEETTEGDDRLQFITTYTDHEAVVSDAELKLLMRLFPDAQQIGVIKWRRRRERLQRKAKGLEIEYLATQYIGWFGVDGMELVIDVDDY